MKVFLIMIATRHLYPLAQSPWSVGAGCAFPNPDHAYCMTSNTLFACGFKCAQVLVLADEFHLDLVKAKALRAVEQELRAKDGDRLLYDDSLAQLLPATLVQVTRMVAQGGARYGCPKHPSYAFRAYGT